MWDCGWIVLEAKVEVQLMLVSRARLGSPHLSKAIFVCLLVSVAVVSSSCSWTSKADVDDRLESSELRWLSECSSKFYCAEIEVPVDWQGESTEQMTLTVGIRLGDDRASTKTLFLHPGGPGQSGLNALEQAESTLSEKILSDYNVVAYDPRGVGQSSGFTCATDTETDRLRSTKYESTDSGISAARTDMQALYHGCVENGGVILSHLDLASNIEDIEAIRIALGVPTMDLLTFSYGTLVGMGYLETHREHVDKLILDGPVNPQLPLSDQVIQQAAAMEKALGAYLVHCLSNPGCPFSGDAATAKKELQQLLSRIGAQEMPTSNDERPLTGPLAGSAITAALYDDRFWYLLTEALHAAKTRGEGDALLAMSDMVAGRDEQGSYAESSLYSAFAIGCADHPMDSRLDSMLAQSEQLKRVAPTLGPYFGFGAVKCESWQGNVRGIPFGSLTSPESPVLIIGTTGDPATPYEWATTLASSDERSLLLTNDGEGHTAYGRSSPCIEDAVDEYLLGQWQEEKERVCQ